MIGRYHYWITNKKNTILPLYWLDDKGEKTSLPTYIYDETNKSKLNRSYVLRENLVVHETEIYTDYYVVKLNDNVRFIYNDEITILEVDRDPDINFAETTFETLCTESKDDSNVLFFVE